MAPLGVMGLYTETSLHCGAESGSGYVDLPVQRERHTGYPVIPGSTVKGVLRDEMRNGPNGGGSLSKEEVDRFFGTEDATGPGRVSFGDGILAAFPVRSSAAPFHWVTCPFVLERVGRALRVDLRVEEPKDGRAWAKQGGEVLVEELRLAAQALPSFYGEGGGLETLLGLLPGEGRGFAHTRKLFPERLLIVSDGDFGELVETATEVVTRIKLNILGTTTTAERKDLPEELRAEASDTDLQGNLFVQELVPGETLFLCPLRALEGEEGFSNAASALRVMRLGGDETIGRGVTHVTWVGSAAESEEG
jgi:CRISPR-associated protein Cmr4